MTLRPPISPTLEMGDVVLSNAMLAGDVGIAAPLAARLGCFFPNLANVGRRELPIRLSLACRIASAQNHVRHIVGVIANSKVGGVHTRRVIARVEDVGSVRDRAVVQFPGKPMGDINSAFAPRSHLNASVAKPVSASRPFDAARGRDYCPVKQLAFPRTKAVPKPTRREHLAAMAAWLFRECGRWIKLSAHPSLVTFGGAKCQRPA